MIAALLLLSGCAGTTGIDSAKQDAPEDAQAFGCAELATEAVAISAADQSGSVKLLKVRAPEIVKDRRDSFATPSGAGESLVLSCEGRGVWSDGGKYRVRYRVSVDSDGEAWVFYKPIF